MFTCGNLNNDNHDLYSKFCWGPGEWVFQCAFRYRSHITDGEAWSMPSYQTSDTLLSQVLGLSVHSICEKLPMLQQPPRENSLFLWHVLITRDSAYWWYEFTLGYHLTPHLAFTNDVQKRLLSIPSMVMTFAWGNYDLSASTWLKNHA